MVWCVSSTNFDTMIQRFLPTREERIAVVERERREGDLGCPPRVKPGLFSHVGKRDVSKGGMGGQMRTGKLTWAQEKTAPETGAVRGCGTDGVGQAAAAAAAAHHSMPMEGGRGGGRCRRLQVSKLAKEKNARPPSHQCL
ncbi:uncharacterized protein VTP21DRAFT_5842 [Calcarisporiella thermophila]|uniref:uncharacterized protein n=1 Tax=Calcarisporiella thermophila TaxID=911321 RepID=UPI003743C53A